MVNDDNRPPFPIHHSILNSYAAVLFMAAATPLSAYVHIPFCRKRCRFCYFKVYTDKDSSEIKGYIDAVLKEFALYAGKPFVGGRKPKFIYFGGGTPSLLSPAAIDGRLPAESELEGQHHGHTDQDGAENALAPEVVGRRRQRRRPAGVLPGGDGVALGHEDLRRDDRHQRGQRRHLEQLAQPVGIRLLGLALADRLTRDIHLLLHRTFRFAAAQRPTTTAAAHKPKPKPMPEAVEYAKTHGLFADRMSEADRAAETVMRRLIKQNFPDHGVIGEEFGEERSGAEYVWILDPIDGTKSFISSGGFADVALVFGMTDKAKGHRGISALLVEKDDIHRFSASAAGE